MSSGKNSFSFFAISVMHDTFSAPVISFVTGYRHSPFGLFRTSHPSGSRQIRIIYCLGAERLYFRLGAPFPIILKSPWHLLIPQKIFGSMPCPIDLGSDFMALCPTRCGSRHGRNRLPHISKRYIVRMRQFANQTLWFSANPTAGFLPQPSFIRKPSSG